MNEHVVFERYFSHIPRIVGTVSIANVLCSVPSMNAYSYCTNARAISGVHTPRSSYWTPH